MSMIHVSKTPYLSYQIVDNRANGGFGPESIVQSEQELRELLIAKGVKRDEIEGHLATLKETGEITIIITIII